MSVVILKPDEIGDFLMATGAIRLLAQKHGEENTTLVVKSEIAPLAQREFPRATIIGFPWQPRRKGRNQTAANLRGCLPVWRRLRTLRPAQSVCLRSARSHMHSFLFAAPKTAERFAAENVLLANGSARRRLLEWWLVRFARATLVPYPETAGALPLELSSHRAVVAAALGLEAGQDAIMPSLSCVPWRGGEGWLLCPLSSSTSKDYSAERWAAALLEAARTFSPKAIRLAGGPHQNAPLQDFAAVLRRAGIGCPVEVPTALPLEKFPERIAAADLVLTVDTAAAHFACAMGAPAVIVDSGKHPGTYGPYSRNGRQAWLVADRERLGRSRWQESVPPPRVAAAVVSALQT